MTDRDDQETLLDRVQKLTRPEHRKERQEIRKDGRPAGWQTITVTTPPLLEQLDDAIRSNMGASTPGASDPATRSVINIAAMLKLVQISSQIMDWARIAGSEVRKGDAAGTLDAWYVRHEQIPDASDTFYKSTLKAWAGQIKGVLDPPRESDLPDACPVCGATEWWSTETFERYYRPLVIRYRPTGADMVEKATALCRACEQVWSVRELAYELEQAEKRRQEAG